MSTDTERESGMSGIERSELLEDLKRLLRDTLQLGPRSARFTAETPLLGHVPELDSMAVVAVLTAVEERFGFVVDDSEISAETFATLGSFADFVAQKIPA
jgi:acyl carrier protein